MLTSMALITVVLPAAANYSGFINRNPPQKEESTTLIAPPAKKPKFNFDFDFDLPEDTQAQQDQDTAEPPVETEPAVAEQPAPTEPAAPAAIAKPVAPEPAIETAPSLAETPADAEPARVAAPASPEPASVQTPEPVILATPVEPVPAVTTITERFQRLSDDGNPATGDTTWACVEDNRNGLVWEVKTSDGGIRDTTHSYTWYNPATQRQSGTEDGGRCDGGIDCDTHSYQQAVNNQKLCGYDDWRLPTRQELETLVTFRGQGNNATIDTDYFPEAIPSWYWTASSNTGSPQYAWYVLFRNGVPLSDLKQHPKHIRLVRGRPPTLASRE